MISAKEFARRMNLDETAMREVLARPGRREDTVWYVQLVLGIGAWITAAIGLVFVGFFLYEILDLEEPGLGVSFLGALIFGAALWPLTTDRPGSFLSQLLIAAASCGASLGVLGVGFEMESAAAAFVASLPFLVAVIVIGRAPLLQFLLAGLSVTIVAVLAFDEWEAHAIDFLSLSAPLGAFLVLYPPARDMRPTAMALLLSIPILLILWGWVFNPSITGNSASIAGTAARILCAGTLAAVIGLDFHYRRETAPNSIAVYVIVALAIMGAAMLSPGLASTLLIMALGYLLGRMALAGVGAVGFAYFLWGFYFDLQQTLLVKSLILMFVGAVLLAAAILSWRRAALVVKS